ncbi:hypothetical protein BS47DRAFT_1369011 [Hydnum rufescens UP504]|uniref:HECT domain-containing protein n=1 Tax=Hydnum rufescens UP504 TaxID=1448309 RepID=A0A9P6AE21_9AGAM|nr:hypothetical protein BS47DRAFT_1369011 [Hydnum rufescens UP504]
MVVPYNATSSNPTRDNCGKQSHWPPANWNNEVMLSTLWVGMPQYSPQLIDCLYTRSTGAKHSFCACKTRLKWKYRPKKGIEGNKTNDESWDPWLGVWESGQERDNEDGTERQSSSPEGTRQKRAQQSLSSQSQLEGPILRGTDRLMRGGYRGAGTRGGAAGDGKVERTGTGPGLLGKDTVNIIFETFTISEGHFDRTVTIKLKSGGANVPATEENNKENMQTIIECHAEHQAHGEFNTFLPGSGKLTSQEFTNALNQCNPNSPLVDQTESIDYQEYEMNNKIFLW